MSIFRTPLRIVRLDFFTVKHARSEKISSGERSSMTSTTSLLEYHTSGLMAGVHNAVLHPERNIDFPSLSNGLPNYGAG